MSFDGATCLIPWHKVQSLENYIRKQEKEQVMADKLSEIQVCANIQKLIAQLNGELRAAHEHGLRVYVGTLGILASGPERLSVRVWRETELLREPSGDSNRIAETL